MACMWQYLNQRPASKEHAIYTAQDYSMIVATVDCCECDDCTSSIAPWLSKVRASSKSASPVFAPIRMRNNQQSGDVYILSRYVKPL